jgi:hypothetical protein
LKNGTPSGKGYVANCLRGKDWIYNGDLDSVFVDGQGEMKNVKTFEWYKGTFHHGGFVAGECSVGTGDFYFTVLGYAQLSGFYQGQCVGVTDPVSRNGGLLIPVQGDPDFKGNVLMPQGPGKFELRQKNNQTSEEEYFVLDGNWQDGEFKGKGRVTKKIDGSSLEGEFGNNILVRGKADNVRGFFFGMKEDADISQFIYTGQVSNGVPDGEGDIVQGWPFGKDQAIDIKFSGTFRNGKWWNGKGSKEYEMNRETYIGEWRDGEFYSGDNYMTDNGHLNRYVYVNGKCISHDVYAGEHADSQIIQHIVAR